MTRIHEILAGYRRVEGAGGIAIVSPEAPPGVAAALLYREGCSVVTDARGRGRVFRFALGNGSEAVLRPCRRGGAVGRLVGDRYFVGNRALEELRTHAWAWHCALSVPEPLGVMWRKAGWGYRAAVATVRVKGHSLESLLAAGNLPAPETVMESIGSEIRALHEAGLAHPDLQVRNVLVDGERAMLIDFDRVSYHNPVGEWRKAANLLRFRRSLAKNGFDSSLFHAVCRGYGIDRFPAPLDAVYRIKGWASDLLSGRPARRAGS